MHLLELLALLLDAEQLLLEDLVRVSLLLELVVCFAEVVTESLGRLTLALALKGYHDLNTASQIGIEQLPLVCIRRQKGLLINDQVLNGVEVNLATITVTLALILHDRIRLSRLKKIFSQLLAELGQSSLVILFTSCGLVLFDREMILRIIQVNLKLRVL